MGIEIHAVKDGVGEVYKLDISLDEWSSTAYRYSTHAGVDSSNVYDPRIVGISDISRGFGEDNVVRPGTVTIALANDDELADWLVQAQSSDYLKARFRLSIGLYALPSAPTTALSPSDIEWEQLGEYALNDPPVMDEGRIVITLDDDSAIALDQPIQLPTTADWYNGDANCPMAHMQPGYGNYAPSGEWLFDIQLAFGDDWFDCKRATHSLTTPGATVGGNAHAFAVCAVGDNTVDPGAATDVAAGDLRAHLLDDLGPGAERGRMVDQYAWNPNTSTFDLVWECKRSAAFTAHGKNWRIVYLVVYENGFKWWLQKQHPSAYQSATPVNGTPIPIGTQLIDRLVVRGYPFSARSNTASATQHPSRILEDIALDYAPKVVGLDTTSLLAFRNNFATLSAAGTIGGWGENRSRTLRDIISDLSSSFDFDAYFTRNGTLAVSDRGYDYASQTGTLVEVEESRISEFSQQVQPRETRNAPFNRIEFFDTRVDSTLHPLRRGSGIFVFPVNYFDQQPNGGSSWGRILTRKKSARWKRSADATLGEPTGGRGADVYIRPVATFVTDAAAIQIDTGDRFKLTWTRNLGTSDPYTQAIFRCESWTLVPFRNQVKIRAVWSDDARSVRPFLLDSETYLLRVDSATAGASVTVTDSSTTVSNGGAFLWGDLYDVAAGDILVLQDSTLAVDNFTRFRALKITGVDSPNDGELTISDADLDFDAPGGVAVATWKVVRSHVTYPTAASDPANYPDGGDPYGRVSSDADAYSVGGTGGFTDAHRMREG